MQRTFNINNSLICHFLIYFLKINGKHYVLAFLGFVGMLSFFYIRFIRERFPQQIPFTLTELHFYIVLCICISFLYVIKINLKSKTPNEYVQRLLLYVNLPFSHLDNLLKANKYSLLYIKNLIKYCYPKDYWTQINLIFFLQLIPRIILIIVFLIDVFWFNRLYYFYHILFIGVFPWLYSYHKYSMYHAKELGLVYLETIYQEIYIYEKGWADVENHYEFDENGNRIEVDFEDYYQDDDGNYIDPKGIRELVKCDYSDAVYIKKTWEPHPRNKYHEKTVTIREYLQIVLEKAKDDMKNKYSDNYDFDPSPLPKDYWFKQYEKMTGKIVLDSADYDYLEQDFNEIMPVVVNLSFKLEFLPDQEKSFYMSHINIVMYIFWFIGWSYILLKSFHTLPNLDITLNTLKVLAPYSKIINPFITP